LKSHRLNSVGAALCGRPLTKGFSNSAAHRGAPLHSANNNRKEGNVMLNSFQHLTKSIIQTLNQVQGDKKRISTQPFRVEDIGGLFGPLHNSKGISVLFLIIAMFLMVTIGYVFSYLIPSKQKSVIFPIQSTQAFFIAQSGVEFAVRFATDNNWTTPVLLSNLNNPPNNTRNLGAGRFTLTYTNTAPNLDTLTSVGEVPAGTERRRVRVSNFTSFLSSLILSTPPNPCWCLGTRRLQFFIQNTGSSSITINAFSATWHKSGQPRFITEIDMGTPLVTKFLGPPDYATGGPPVNFNQGGGSQTITPGQVLQIVVNWDNNTNADTIVFTFYDTLGRSYRFQLDSGAGPSSCPAPC
jgi:archaellum component FlaG (FlaF/FlaG flagellin family)